MARYTRLEDVAAPGESVLRDMGCAMRAEVDHHFAMRPVEQFDPAMLVLTSDEETGKLDVAPLFELQPDLRNTTLRLLLRRLDAIAYCLASEAWVAAARSRDDIPADLSTHPESASIVAISGATLKGTRMLATFAIDETAPRRVAKEGNVEIGADEETLQGDLVTLLREVRMS